MDPERHHLLLIEDNEGDARLIREVLKDAGNHFQVTWAGSLEGAMAHTQAPDVILLDLSLPDSRGLETFTRIREAIPNAPVVVLTGRREADAALAALRMGAQDYIVKDRLDGVTLDRSLRYALERERGVAEIYRLQQKVASNDKLAVIGTMVARVAHEVNNPLLFIRSSVDSARIALTRAIEEDGLTPAARAKLEDALRDHDIAIHGLDRIGAIVKELKLTARKEPLERAREDVNAIARQVLVMAAPHMHGVEVRSRLEAKQFVEVNAGAVSQVILNLVLNAIEAMENSEQRRLSILAYDEDDHVVVEVTDSGPGIPPDLEERIFEPFFTTKSAGTGLGLSVSRDIATLEHGSLACRSGPQGGATFILRLSRAGASKEKR